MMSDDDLAWQMSPQGGGKGLYWNTRVVEAADSAQY